MVHQALQRVSLTCCFLIGLFGCTNQPKDIPQESKKLNKATQNLNIQNGIVFLDGKPYNGKLFTFFESTTDTLEIVSYLNGKEHGEWLKFYPNHQLRERRYFNNGQKTGQMLTWWENGKKQIDYYFLNDEYQGTCKEWNENGLLTKVMNYDKGYENGVQQWWYDNGKIKANYIIKNGRRYGLLGTKNCVNVADSVFKK